MFNGVWWGFTSVFLLQFERWGHANAGRTKCGLCERWGSTNAGHAKCGLWRELRDSRDSRAPLRALSVVLRCISDQDKQR